MRHNFQHQIRRIRCWFSRDGFSGFEPVLAKREHTHPTNILKKATSSSRPSTLVYTRHIPLLRGCVASTCAAAEIRQRGGKRHRCHHYCCCCAVPAAMLDREMSLLDIVARHPFFSWLRGKRTRAADSDSSCSIQNTHKGISKRRNSPPPAAPPEDGKEWDRVLPAPVSKLVITAPVSTCSGSTLSRTASWSEATTVGSESEVRTFGRLHSSEGEGAQQDQFTEKSPPPSSHRRHESFQTGMSYTTAAIPINIPCRLDKSEPNTVLQEVWPLM